MMETPAVSAAAKPHRLGGRLMTSPSIPSIPEGFCQCGCGRATKIATYTNHSRGYLAGFPFRYIKGHSPRAKEAIASREWDHAEDCLHYLDGTLKYSIDSDTGCWVWLAAIANTGYGIAVMSDGIRLQAHIAHWNLNNGAVPDGCELDHLCRNRACICLDHLEPVPHAVNVQRGLVAKLSDTDVTEIRKLYADGTLNTVELGHKFSIHNSVVSRIVRNEIWKN